MDPWHLIGWLGSVLSDAPGQRNMLSPCRPEGVRSTKSTFPLSDPSSQTWSVWSCEASEHVHDKVVHLCEHHKVNRQTGAAVLCGRVARQPREGVVLLQNKSVIKTTHTINDNLFFYLLYQRCGILVVFIMPVVYLSTSEVWLESRGWECLLCRSSSDWTEDTCRCKEA